MVISVSKWDYFYTLWIILVAVEIEGYAVSQGRGFMFPKSGDNTHVSPSHMVTSANIFPD